MIGMLSAAGKITHGPAYATMNPPWQVAVDKYIHIVV